MKKNPLLLRAPACRCGFHTPAGHVALKEFQARILAHFGQYDWARPNLQYLSEQSNNSTGVSVKCCTFSVYTQLCCHSIYSGGKERETNSGSGKEVRCKALIIVLSTHFGGHTALTISLNSQLQWMSHQWCPQEPTLRSCMHRIMLVDKIAYDFIIPTWKSLQCRGTADCLDLKCAVIKMMEKRDVDKCVATQYIVMDQKLTSLQLIKTAGVPNLTHFFPRGRSPCQWKD
jgi:hypothetical protein